MNYIKNSLGKINLTIGTLDITDPCYDRSVWCRETISNVKIGEWSCFMYKNSEGRVAKLAIKHEDCVAPTKSLEYISSDIGVDAGLCGFFEAKPDYSDNDWSSICELIEDFDNAIATPDNAFGCVGVVSDSGYGDGCYSVYGHRDSLGYFDYLELRYL